MLSRLPIELLIEITNYLPLAEHLLVFRLNRYLLSLDINYRGKYYPHKQRDFQRMVFRNQTKLVKHLLPLVNVNDQFQHVDIIYEDHEEPITVSALSWAAEMGYPDMVFLLLSDPRLDPTIDFDYPLREACSHGHTETVKCLLQDARIDPAIDHNIGLRTACEQGWTSVVQILLKDTRVDPSDLKNMALRIACEQGHVDIVRLLLSDPRVDPTDQENNALQNACRNGHLSIVKLLLQDGRVDSQDHSQTAIREAALNGYFHIARLLMARQQKVNQDVFEFFVGAQLFEGQDYYPSCIHFKPHDVWNALL
ncbi:ankyrin repeat-containing domain protein [Gorgonomyces haynaldii]|nr:ankyrin repeat-containing domain protein [Gorgonomyces haynaldii]